MKILGRKHPCDPTVGKIAQEFVNYAIFANKIQGGSEVLAFWAVGDGHDNGEVELGTVDAVHEFELDQIVVPVAIGAVFGVS